MIESQFKLTFTIEAAEGTNASYQSFSLFISQSLPNLRENPLTNIIVQVIALLV